MRFATTAVPAGLAALLVAGSAHAQQVIQYDSIQADSEAAITCGFCATEKYGTVFYELGSGGGLPASAFPLSVDNVQLAVASTQVTGSLGTYQCAGSASGGNVNATLEIYAGVTVPTAITSLPASGAWPGEQVVLPANPVQLELSVDTQPGSNQFDLRLNTIAVNVTVPTPNQYLRVVVTVPLGGSSASCSEIGYDPPAFSPFRDDNGRAGPRRSFIYQLGFDFPPLNIPPQWTWVEDITDPITGQRGIDGDWLVRLEVSPAGTPTDAGVTDSGPTVVDAGTEDTGVAEDSGVVADSGVVEDAGVEPADSGAGLPPPTITGVSPDELAFGASGSLTIVGTGFREGASVRLDQITLEVRLLSGSTTLVVDVPTGIAAGTYDVLVANADGQTAILADGFTVKGTSTPVDSKEGCRCVTAPVDGLGSLGGLGLVLGLWAQRRRRRPSASSRASAPAEAAAGAAVPRPDSVQPQPASHSGSQGQSASPLASASQP